MRSNSIWFLTIVLWLGLVAGGMVALGRYEFTPGLAAHPAASWPAASKLRRETERATVILAGHPRCPCTRATLSELERIHARARFRLHVLFYQPPAATPDWRSGLSWQLAQGLPDCSVHPDPESREAGLFDAHTSGQVVAYDRTGQLIFSGGITGSRGHSGDNAGADELLRVLAGQPAHPDFSSQVFGCSLREGDQTPEGDPLCKIHPNP